jgi:hypothetical protein
VRTRALSSSSPFISPTRSTIYLLANNCRNEREMRCPVHGCEREAPAGIILSHIFCAHSRLLYTELLRSREDVAAGRACDFAAWYKQFSHTS